ncbi:MAG TPA: response regulator [Polyangiales bacterium]|nr:response regulator [Polyangiales bacterium]
MAQGEELLIAEGSERDREGLRKLFESDGYIITAAESGEQARDLLRRKFFPVALIDLDFEGTNEGLSLASYIEQHSRPTRIVMITGRRSFDAAVRALRTGVVDIVNKRPDQVDHLRAAVSLALDRYHSGSKDSALLREARGVLEDAMRILLALGRKLYGGEGSSGAGLKMKPAILIVDEDHAFLQQVANLLAERPWDISVEMSGGSGLDKASTFSFQIICVRDELGDLPGQMLLKSAQAQRTAALGLLYSQRGQGKIERYEQGHATRNEAPFKGPNHLVEAMAQLVDELALVREERRYLQAFRAEHGMFFKRFAELKARIDSLAG